MKNYLLVTLLIAATTVLGAKLEVANDRYNQLINDSLVKPIYEECQKIDPAGDKISTCIWKELENRPDQKEAILAKYFSDDSETKYNTVSIKTVDKETSAAVKKLEDYMYKKLQKAFYGEAKDRSKGTKVVDHRVFYELYKNQMSKNIISTISSYCLEASTYVDVTKPPGEKPGELNEKSNRRRDYLISANSDQRKEVKKFNIKSLKSQTRDTETNKDVNTAYSYWGGCLSNVTEVCKKKDTGRDEDIKYSKGRACIVSDHLRQLRQGLIEAEKMETQFNKVVDTGGYRPANLEVYTGKSDNDTLGIDDLTSITSNEFAKESGYKKALEDKKIKIAECKNSGDFEPCQKYLSSSEDKDKLEEALAEFTLRQKLLNEKLAGMENEDLRKFLKTEGRSQQDIERALASDDSKQLVKQQINSAFEAEKNAIKDQIRKSIDKTQVDPNLSDEDKSTRLQTVFQTINDELAVQTDNFTQLIHYNNIVSGFLTIEDNDGKEVGNNIQSITREMSDSAYNGDQPTGSERVPASSNYMDELSEKLNEMVKGKDTTRKEDTTPLGTKKINEHIFKMDYGDEQQDHETTP